MKIIQSIWTKPFFTGEDNVSQGRLNGGWPHRRFNYYSIVFSALQLRKIFGEVELITDSLGKELFADKLQAPFTKVHVALDDIAKYNPHLWALGKIQSYRLQQEPFLHVDTDVFIWKEISADVLHGDLIAQNRELNNAAFVSTFKYVLEKFDYVPAFLEAYNDGKPVPFINAGVLGGKNVDFFQAYTSEVLNFIGKNERAIQACISQPGFQTTDLNILFEQVFFHAMAKERNLDISFLFPQAQDNPPTVGQVFDESLNNGYSHSFGFYKKLKTVYYILEARLQKMYPSNYKHINELLQKCEI